MGLSDDLNLEVYKILRENWTTRDGRIVPEPEDLALRNDAVKIDGTVLYADLDESTALVSMAQCFNACGAHSRIGRQLRLAELTWPMPLSRLR